MSLCKNSHWHLPEFGQLLHDYGGYGRLNYAGCAYELGYEAGLSRHERLHFDLGSLPRRHSPTSKSSC